MRSIFELKKDMLFNREMNELIDILKKTAISQFQSLFAKRRALTHPEKYLGLLESFFKMVDSSKVGHPVMKNPATNLLLVIVTTDMGFLGGLNTDIIGGALRQIDKKDKVHILVIGEKGRDYLEEAKHSFAFLPGITPEISPDEVQLTAHYIFATALREKIGRLIVAYPKFFSFGHQEAECLQLLPRPALIPSGTRAGTEEDKCGIVYEPFLDKVVDYLLRKWLFYRIQDIFWHSKLSEYAARAMHLEGSMRELQDQKRALEFQYFRSQHELTDRTIRDIFGGRLSSERARRKAVTMKS